MTASLHAERGALRLHGHSLRWGERTYLMGIVNVTPDSFSGDGTTSVDHATARALEQAEHADLVDVGAESTRPQSTPVDEETELDRLLPVLTAVRAALPHAILSVDTYKPAVFRAAHAAGADILNSVRGLPGELLHEAARAQAPVVIMHSKERAEYDGDVVDEVLGFLSGAAQRAVSAGIPREHVILDPGIGFGKTADHNLRILSQLRRLTGLGFPTLVGTSRKSTIGKLTGKSQPAQRLAGSLASIALAVAAGIDIVRVHDAEQTRDALRVSDAIVRGWRPSPWT